MPAMSNSASSFAAAFSSSFSRASLPSRRIPISLDAASKFSSVRENNLRATQEKHRVSLDGRLDLLRNPCSLSLDRCPCRLGLLLGRRLGRFGLRKFLLPVPDFLLLLLFRRGLLATGSRSRRLLFRLRFANGHPRSIGRQGTVHVGRKQFCTNCKLASWTLTPARSRALISASSRASSACRSASTFAASASAFAARFFSWTSRTAVLSTFFSPLRLLFSFRFCSSWK